MLSARVLGDRGGGGGTHCTHGWSVDQLHGSAWHNCSLQAPQPLVPGHTRKSGCAELRGGPVISSGVPVVRMGLRGPHNAAQVVHQNLCGRLAVDVPLAQHHRALLTHDPPRCHDPCGAHGMRTRAQDTHTIHTSPWMHWTPGTAKTGSSLEPRGQRVVLKGGGKGGGGGRRTWTPPRKPHNGS